MPAAITPNTPKACLVIDAPIISAAGQRTESQLRRGALGALTDDLVPVQNEASFHLPNPIGQLQSLLAPAARGVLLHRTHIQLATEATA